MSVYQVNETEEEHTGTGNKDDLMFTTEVDVDVPARSVSSMAAPTREGQL